MTRRSLRFEQLERRLLLAGDVNVAISRGDLIVTGNNKPLDGLDETIEIVYLGASKYQVRGLNGTTVKGAAPVDGVSLWESPTVPAVTRDVIVDMKTGNDAVSILVGPDGSRFRVPRNLTIKGGVGMDTLVVQDADVTGAMTLDGGSEKNSLDVLGTTVNKDVVLKGLAGDDILGLGQVEFRGKLTVDTGAGNDQVTINGRGEAAVKDVARDVTVKTGIGDDAVTLKNGTFGGKLTIDTGAGNDKTVTLNGGQVAKDVYVTTGVGDDVVTIENGTLLGKLTVDGGAGIDVVTIDPTSITKDVSLSTGDGDDDVWLKELTLYAKLTINTGNGNDRVGVTDSNVLAISTISIATGGGGDQVGLVRVKTDGHITVNAGDCNGNRLVPGKIPEERERERIGLADVSAKNVTLDGGNSAKKRNGVFGPSEIGVTDGEITGSLTIKTGHWPDIVGIGKDQQLIDRLKELLVDGDDNKLLADDYAGGDVNVTGTVSIGTGSYSGDVINKETGEPTIDDFVLVNNLNANVFRLDTGPGNDRVAIGNEVGGVKLPDGTRQKMQEVTIKTGNDNDTLTLGVVPTRSDWPAKCLVDGGSGKDKLVSLIPDLKNPLPLTYAIFFKNWEEYELLIP